MSTHAFIPPDPPAFIPPDPPDPPPSKLTRGVGYVLLALAGFAAGLAFASVVAGCAPFRPERVCVDLPAATREEGLDGGGGAPERAMAASVEGGGGSGGAGR